MSVWTHGRWTVKPGREEEFLAAFRSLIEDVGREVDIPQPHLTRDRERPNLFLTFARWDSIEAIERFRAVAMPRIGELRDTFLEGLEIYTLDELSADG